jgi:hypothetical protein
MTTTPLTGDIESALLQLPALTAHAGADTTLTTKGPAQAWSVVTAVLCTMLPTLFLVMRAYTRLRIVKSLELVDCTFSEDHGLKITNKDQIACSWPETPLSTNNASKPLLIV